MEIGNFKIEGHQCYESLCLFIRNNLEIQYEKDLGEGKLFCGENFSWMTYSDLMVAITVQKINSSPDECEVEIIAGGGGSGLFHIRRGNESRRINNFYEIVTDLCDEKGWSISEFTIA